MLQCDSNAPAARSNIDYRRRFQFCMKCDAQRLYICIDADAGCLGSCKTRAPHPQVLPLTAWNEHASAM